MVFTGILAFVACCWLTISIYLLINTRKIDFLHQQPISDNCPSLVIIVAVRNEEAELENALASLCNLNYNNYRILVVNDRSTDKTPVILKKLSAKYPRITTVNIIDLPGGWLGKNHALYQGYLHSTEDWLLFTDADIVFDSNTLRKAMSYVQQHQLDHLAVLPHITSRSAVLNSFFETFALMLFLKLRPWLVSSPQSSASIGIGAFNLVNKKAYMQAGTHKAIRLRPDDDLKLGERIKQSGGRQGVLYGKDEISLEWYTSIREFINGLMKNTFSVSDYNVGKALMTALATFLFFCVPVPAGLLSGSPIPMALSVFILITQACLLWFKKGHPNRWWYFLMIPVAGAVMTWIIFRSAYLTIINGGIYWRDTFYSLKELKNR